MVSVDQAYMVGHMKNADGSINNKKDVYKRQGVDIFVKTDDAEKAVQLIKEINNQE